MPFHRTGHLNPKAFLLKANSGKTMRIFDAGQFIFRQGDPADAVYYVDEGRVKRTVFSEGGKEAVVALLGQGSFFGESCLAGQLRRTSNAVALERASIVRIEKRAMIRLLHANPDFEDTFLAYLIARNMRVEEDLVDQIFNSSEKRLARVLLLLARFGKDSKPEPLMTKVSQETLAAMVGTTRSRISFFMNKFKRLGFIEYEHGLRVHSSLLNVVLHD